MPQFNHRKRNPSLIKYIYVLSHKWPFLIISNLYSDFFQWPEFHSQNFDLTVTAQIFD